MSINGDKLKTFFRKKELERFARDTVKVEQAKKRLADLEVKKAKSSELRALKAKIRDLKLARARKISAAASKTGSKAGKATAKGVREIIKFSKKSPEFTGAKKTLRKKARKRKRKSTKRKSTPRRSYDIFGGF